MAKWRNIWIVLIFAAAAVYGLYVIVPSTISISKATQPVKNAPVGAPIKLKVLARIAGCIALDWLSRPHLVCRLG